MSGQDTQMPSEFLATLTGILSHHDAIAAALVEASRRFIGQRRRQVLTLSRFFALAPSAERVVGRPDALAVCVQLLANQTANAQSWQIDDSVASGLDQIGPMQSSAGRLRVLLAYPMAVLILGGIIACGYFLFLVPIFDDMFQEFGLELAPATEMIIDTSRLMNSYWPVILGVIGLVAIAIVCIGILGRHRDLPVWSNWCSSFFVSRRESLIQGATHLAMLYQSGLPIVQALRIAATSSRNAWLNVKYDQSKRKIQLGDVGRSRNDSLAFPGCSLLSHAIAECQSVATGTPSAAALLSTSATIYRERAHSRQTLWLAWISPLAILVTSFFIGTLVLALFMPLVSLIRALSY